MAFNKPKAHERAERYAANGKHDRAAREYQAIVEHDPTDVRAWLMLADCLVRCGDEPGAIERYVRVAEYYVEAREHNKALAVYGQVLNLDGQRIDIQTKVAALNVTLGRIPDAIAQYERVAHAQMQMGRVKDALETYRIVADADPTAIARRLRLAELYSREKRKREAVEAFREAGVQLREAGRMGDFVRVAERLLYHDDNDLPTIRDLARAYLELGEPRRSLMKLNGLLRANPKDEEGIELLAETFMALGKPEKALSALEELARGLRARGPAAKDDAIRILRRGLQWRPGHAEFREALLELEGPRRGAPADDDDLGLEMIDESDLVELDDDDLVLEEPDAPGTTEEVAFPSEPSTPVALPEAPSSAPGTRRTAEVEALPSVEPSLTQSVLSEVETDGRSEVEELTDFDKILFEARVYIKYRLFEHALEHVMSALSQQPEHLGALSLQARALTELGRGDEAAEIHLRVAGMVMQRDPKLAREHVGAARSLRPDHPELPNFEHALRGAVGEPASSPEAEAVPDEVEEDGDSGAFDLVSDDYEDLVADAVGSSPELEAPANLIAAHDDEPSVEALVTQPFSPRDLEKALIRPPFDDTGRHAVPQRPTGIGIGIGIVVEDEGPEPAQTGRTLLPWDGQEPPSSPGQPMQEVIEEPSIEILDDGELDSVELGSSELHLESGSTQAIEIEPEHTDVLLTLPDDDEGFDEGVPELAPEPAPEPASVAEPPPADATSFEDEPSFHPGAQFQQVLDEPSFDPDAQFRLLAEEPEPAAELLPAVEEPAVEPSARFQPVVDEPSFDVDARFEQVVESSAPAYPDLSDDLAEIRFYVDQGLDEDAEAALEDLEQRYPGHPEIAAFRGTAVPVEPPTVLVEAEAAEPLVKLDADDGAAGESLISFDEDEDEDAYLSAIFAEPSESPAKKPEASPSSAQANLAEGQSVDAATAFDLGVAYREMGLVDAAITQFETAASDPQWQARALTMLGTLRAHRGETEQAITDFNEAVRLASTTAESSEAAYELGVLYEMLGDTGSAIAQFLQVDAGFRDRDERLAQLGV